MDKDDSLVVRKVYFFRIAHFEGVKEALPAACARIADLKFNDNGRYRKDGATPNIYSLYPDTTSYPLKIRFGKIRRDALPQVEHEGVLETLNLQEDEGLVDISHITIFGDGFVAAEWNSDGPKIAQLTPYFVEKGGLNDPPKFLTLVERDIVEIVSSLDSVRVLEIELPPDAVELARQADQGLADAIKATSELGGNKKIGLKLTADVGNSKLKSLAVKLAKLIKENPHERDRFNLIQASGYSDGVRTSRLIDVLESKMVSGEEFTRTSARARSIDSEDAYKVLQKSYDRNLTRLTSAAMSGDM